MEQLIHMRIGIGRGMLQPLPALTVNIVSHIAERKALGKPIARGVVDHDQQIEIGSFIIIITGKGACDGDQIERIGATLLRLFDDRIDDGTVAGVKCRSL